MRQFKNFVEMINELPREVFTRGIHAYDKTVQGKIIEGQKDFEQKELVGVCYTINDISDKEEMLKRASELFDKKHIRKEVGDKWFWDMLHNNSLLETWWFEDEFTAQYFLDFCNEGTKKDYKASYSYGKLIIPQLPFLIKRLQNNLYAKGAYIDLFNIDDVAKIGRRTPCTLSYGFRTIPGIFGNKLTLFVHMRSQDLCNFMALDLYKASLLLEHVAKELNVLPGKIICYVDSLHAYYRDIKDKNIIW